MMAQFIPVEQEGHLLEALVDIALQSAFHLQLLRHHIRLILRGNGWYRVRSTAYPFDAQFEGLVAVLRQAFRRVRKHVGVLASLRCKDTVVVVIDQLS